MQTLDIIIIGRYMFKREQLGLTVNYTNLGSTPSNGLIDMVTIDERVSMHTEYTVGLSMHAKLKTFDGWRSIKGPKYCGRRR